MEELEALKKAWEEAEALAKASPDSKDLLVAAAEAKKAYDEAREKDSKTKDDQSPGDDDPKWDEKTKAYIKKLRDESASHRTKSKDLASKLQLSEKQKKDILKAAGIETESEKPEELVKVLSAGNNELAFRTAVLQSALEQGIASDDVEYYEFLIRKATAELDESDELSEDALRDIAKKCKKTKSTSTSVGNGGKSPPNPDGNSQLTLDQFVRMNISEKSLLYQKQPELYSQLWAEAKSKKRLHA